MMKNCKYLRVCDDYKRVDLHTSFLFKDTVDPSDKELFNSPKLTVLMDNSDGSFIERGAAASKYKTPRFP